jgi:hypothetical protein
MMSAAPDAGGDLVIEIAPYRLRANRANLLIAER